MTNKIKAIVLSLGVVSAALGTAVVVERVALAQGAASIDASVTDPPVSIGAAVVAPAAFDPTVRIITVAPATPAPAMAPVIVPATIDPVTTASSFLTFARTGKGRLALGAAITLFVWGLRSFATKISKWFATPLGGYVLGFGSTAALYFGTALVGDLPISFDLLADALATSFAASGKWEALRDAMKSVTGAVPSIAKSAALALCVTMAGSYALTSACTGPGPLPIIGNAVIDCSLADQAGVESLVAEFRTLLVGHRPDWSTIYTKAIAAGKTIGGCALAKIVGAYMGDAQNTADDGGWSAHSTLELFRATQTATPDSPGGASFLIDGKRN